MDQFMQRFNLVHSNSIFDKVRYLGRRKFRLGFKKYSSSEFFEANFIYNSRSVNFDNMQTNSWSKLYLNLKKEPLLLNLGYFKTKYNYGLDYLIEIKKNISSIDFLFETSLINKLYHPNHVYMYSGLYKQDTYKVFSSKFSMKWSNERSKILLSVNALSELNNKLLEKIIPTIVDDSELIDNQSYCLQLLSTRKLLDGSEIKFNYEQRNPYHYASGGYGRLIKLNFIKNIKYFQKYMNSIVSMEYTFFGDRLSRSRINYIEQTPYFAEQLIKLDNVSLLNSYIKISVSDFTFKYEWKNLTEIIQKATTKENTIYTRVNPEMLPIGTLMNFSVEWHFDN